MRIVLSTAAAAFICGLATVQASRASDFDTYVKCAMAANNRANAQHCDAYKESIACGEKALAVAPNPRSAQDVRGAIAHSRKAARQDGCRVD
jgi:hypothetical protein